LNLPNTEVAIKSRTLTGALNPLGCELEECFYLYLNLPKNCILLFPCMIAKNCKKSDSLYLYTCKSEFRFIIDSWKIHYEWI